MFAQLGRNLWVTKVFIFVRFVAALLVSLVYIFFAAAVQDMFVKFFGENTFNYIVGGIMSLFLGIVICNYLGRLLFMFVRGWHVAALAYAKKIQVKHLSALDAGMRVFSRHFTSFAVVYGASALLGKLAENGAERIWDIMEDVPYLGSLSKIADFPLVKKLARDLIDTGFDAVIFYIVRYSKAGIGDDMEQVPKAMKKYLYALPSVMMASFSSYLLLYLLPMALRVICIVLAFLNEGFLAGILITVLLYPLFFTLQRVLLDPVETTILLSAFAKHCNDEELEEAEEGSVYRTVIDGILSSIGFENLGGEGDEEEEAEYFDEPEEEAEAEPVPEPAPAPTPRRSRARAMEASSSRDRVRSRIQGGVSSQEDEVVHIPPSFEEDDVDDIGVPTGLHIPPVGGVSGVSSIPDVSELPLSDEQPSPGANRLSQLIRQSQGSVVVSQAPKIPKVSEVSEEPEVPEIPDLATLLGSLSAEELNQEWSTSDDAGLSGGSLDD